MAGRSPCWSSQDIRFWGLTQLTRFCLQLNFSVWVELPFRAQLHRKKNVPYTVGLCSHCTGQLIVLPRGEKSYIHLILQSSGNGAPPQSSSGLLLFYEACSGLDDVRNSPLFQTAGKQRCWNRLVLGGSENQVSISPLSNPPEEERESVDPCSVGTDPLNGKDGGFFARSWALMDQGLYFTE